MPSNEKAFFYEICNVWTNDVNGASKNFQAFYVFSYSGETYFKVPNLSMKIRTKSDYDNTEVKLLVSYDMLPELVNLFNRSLTEDSQVSGHNFTIYISKVSNDTVKLKMTNSQNMSNDVLLSISLLKNMITALKVTYNSIISMSLDFIKIAQNNELLNKLDNVESMLKEKICFVQTLGEQKEYSGKTMLLETVNNTFMEPTVDMVSEPVSVQEPIVAEAPEQEQTNSVPEMYADIDSENSSNTEVDDFSIDNNDTSTSIPTENTFQNELDSIVKQTLEEDPRVTLRNRIHDIIQNVYDTTKKGVYDILDIYNRVFMALELYDSHYNKDIKILSDYSTYFGTSFSSYMLYLEKLCFLTSNYKLIPSTVKVPMFIFRVRLPDTYAKNTKTFNEALLDLYKEYKDIPSPNDFQLFVLSCLKYAFAPFWSSYLNVTSDNFENDKLLSKLKLMTSKFLLNWEASYMDNLDKFITSCGLTFTNDSNLNRFLASQLPLVSSCFKQEPTLQEVKEMNRLIKELNEKYCYEELNWSDTDIDNLSDTFLKTIKACSKSVGITKATSLEELFVKCAEHDYIPQNITEELKGLKAMDSHNGEMVANS